MKKIEKILKYLPFVFIFLLFFLAPIDTDLGWHLRYGEYFWQTGEFLRENTLTYFLKNYEWSNSYSLYQPLVFGIYKFCGIFGIAAASGIIGVLIFWIFGKINPRLTKINLPLFLAAVFFGWNVFALGFRAQIFSILGVVATFWLLGKSVANRKLLFWFPVIFIVWANFHGGFVLGLLLLGFFTVNSFFTDRKNSLPLAAATIISTAAACANPYGCNIFAEAWQHVEVPLENLIAEWVPPSPLAQSLIITAVVILIFGIWQSRNREKIFWSLALAAFAFLAFGAKRHLPIFAFAGILALAEIFAEEFQKIESGKFPALVRNLLLIFGVPFLIFVNLPANLAPLRSAENYCHNIPRNYPCEAIDFLAARKTVGKNIFSQFEWGGFLEWQLPQNRYFVDGRMPAWSTENGKSPYTIYLEIIQARRGWQNLLAEYETDLLLIDRGTFLDLELQKNKNLGWREIFRGERGVIYEKNSSTSNE